MSGNNSVVECDLAKVEVAGSNPVSRSTLTTRFQSLSNIFKLVNVVQMLFSA